MRRSLSIVFMCNRITKVDQQSITEMLGYEPLIALNHCFTRLVIPLYDRVVVFGIELSGQGCGADQVHEHHRELASFTYCSVRPSRCLRLRSATVSTL